MPIGTGLCEGGVVALICGGVARQKQREYKRRRREHEEIVQFLRTAPLLKRQLPKADIPLLAAELRRRLFRPGALLVRQGQMQEEMFFIAKGEALVSIEGEECARMTKGDLWGNSSLLRKRPSLATVQASGSETLVAFFLTHQQFLRLGLHRRLRLPRMSAIQEGRGQGAGAAEQRPATRQQGGLTSVDWNFIVDAVERGTTLREFHAKRSDVIRAAAQKATVRTVKAGNAIVCSGEFSREFYVVCRGEVVVIPPLCQPQSSKSSQALLALEKLQQESTAALPTFGSERQLLHSPSSRLSFMVEQDSPRCIQSTGTLPGKTYQGEPLPRLRPRALTMMSKPMLRLGRGCAFGEDVMLYNARHAATFRAAEGSDVQLYVVARQDYMQFVHGCERYKEWCDLLDEASALSILFQSQRHELARHAHGYKEFDRGAMVVKPGRCTKSPLVYVVAAGEGKALIPAPGKGPQAVHEVPLRRGDTFGERLLPCDHEEAGSFSVQAGSQKHSSLTCLCIGLELFQASGVSQEDLDDILSPFVSRCSVGSARPLLSRTQLNPVDLEPVRALGSGGFGFVTLQRDRQTQQLYALKRISKGIIPRSFYVNVCAERDLMELADSDFIVRLICSYRDENFLYMVLEPVLGGDLDQARHCPDFLEPDPVAAVMFYVACIIAGLEHLHERHVVYRDVKPENALLDSRGYAKLCDMGMARFVVGKTFTFCGTPAYMAPEVLICTGHDAAVDWWSLGVLTVDLLAGEPPWPVLNDGMGGWVKPHLAAQRRGFNPAMLPEHLHSAALRDFVKALLTVDPQKRLGGGSRGAAEVRSHRWFREACFDFVPLHQQDEAALSPPFRPEVSLPPVLPQPDFRRDIPVKMKEGYVLNGGKVIHQERLLLHEAVSRLEEDASCDGIYARVPTSPDQLVFVFFIQQKRGDPPSLDQRPHWVAYVKDRHLFEPYTRDAANPNWDSDFEPPPPVFDRITSGQ